MNNILNSKIFAHFFSQYFLQDYCICILHSIEQPLFQSIMRLEALTKKSASDASLSSATTA